MPRTVKSNKRTETDPKTGMLTIRFNSGAVATMTKRAAEVYINAAVAKPVTKNQTKHQDNGIS